ncbi:bifunctional (p)ppGpp synthetase/guanosine-3',5'-bis(diphosphate) 3'-pyrophosphohydrolase [Candidatus Falkowbacteria bacterium]|nr:bifunctional (p)ppGpp synthetase/guanosine-3',5'-bis(diphosphate) 3'-pyrophosphohydrolase [Candidatus Falkowbacteria bacterium]
MTIEQIINRVKENDPEANTDLVLLAYEFAEEAHRGQLRKSGEPYIQHPLHTAFVLAEIKADLNTIIAGLLHDVPEDTQVTLEDVKKNFGEEVAKLVEGITKLSKIKYRGIERYAESLRKMFLFMAEDLRVILIKFADRLHNLKTLEHLPPEKQKRIAQETMEIYAPIAGLLGVWRLKWQMEDICFKILHPDDFQQLQQKYEVEQKAERDQLILKSRNILDEKLEEAGIKHETAGRFKHLYSIWQKMNRKDRRFDEIQDVFALRVIVDSVEDCYKVLGIIHSIWRPKISRFKDYIAVPKPNGYRSLHTTVFGIDGKATEFQIRTRKMDEEALYGVAAHIYYKLNSHSHDKKNEPRWIKELLDLQKSYENTHDFAKRAKFEVFGNRIFVFTPKGDVYDLPSGSTIIDFAYAVHTDIGNHCTSAMINDKIAPLDAILKSGDLVEVVTDKKRKGPSRDWLKFVKTHRARAKIKQSVATESRFDQLKRFIPGIK